MEQNKFWTTILPTEVLAEHLADPDWVVIDCRFDLQNPGWGLEDYQVGHIPGAVYANVDTDLSSPRTPETGRHPLPDPAQWIKTLSGWGVESGKQVVAYDTTGGSFAARLWWLLRWVGHDQVALLDGGYPKWVRENRPVHTGIETRKKGKFRGKPRPELVAIADEVERLRQDPEYLLIDARSAVRFRGEEEPIDPIAGHIPGAVNRFHGNNLEQDGTFLQPEALRTQFSGLLDQVSPEQAVVYCGSGVTSCHHLVAMEIAGLPGARLYAGSWSEWIRDPARPRTTGGEKGAAGV